MKVKFNNELSRFEVVGEKTEDVNRFLDALTLRGLSQYSVRSYGYDLIVIYRWLEKYGFKMENLKGKDLYDLIRFEKSHGKCAKTINRKLITLQVFYRFLFDRDIERGPGLNTGSGHYWGAGTDFKGLRIRKERGRSPLRIKEDELVVVPLTAKEANEFVKEITSYRNLAIVGLMLFCGLRSCEVRGLEIEKVDFSERKITVRGKGGRERMVPLTDQVLRVMKAYLDLERPRKVSTTKLFVVAKGKSRGNALTASGLRSLFRYRRKISGVGKANPHRFRHTFGTNMAQSKMNIWILQELLGHARGSPVTQRYVHFALADVADAFYETNHAIEKKYSTL